MTPAALRADALRASAGRAHRDATSTISQRRAAELHGTTDRTQRTWNESGPPAAVEFDRFLLASPDPWRWRAHVEVTAKMATLDRLSERGLIERVRELRERQAELEAQVRMEDLRRADLCERAVTQERLAAVTAELSAAYLLCAEKKLSETEVLG